jgi:PTH1 family peptidyl-tRNA hydrolase
VTLLKLVVGLGNPGERYQDTRHNIGFKIVDDVARRLDASMHHKGKSMVAELSHAGEKIVLLKPLTFMNLSGEAVSEAVRYWQCPVENVLVIHDDLDLPFGRLRLRLKGGHGGHNGLRSILTHLGQEQFKRLKVGIGRPEDGDVTRYVLAPFSPLEQNKLADVIQLAGEAVSQYIEGHDFMLLMNKYNQHPQQE